MKITCGGSMGFKKQGKPYESIDANTFFTIEKEVPDDWPKEKLEELFNKTNEILSREATKKMKVAYTTYMNYINNVAENMGE